MWSSCRNCWQKKNHSSSSKEDQTSLKLYGNGWTVVKLRWSLQWVIWSVNLDVSWKNGILWSKLDFVWLALCFLVHWQNTLNDQILFEHNLFSSLWDTSNFQQEEEGEEEGAVGSIFFLYFILDSNQCCTSVYLTTKSISTSTQYVTLDNKIKYLSLASSFFGNSADKTGTAFSWELLIANHLDQSLWSTNQKYWAADRSNLLHFFFWRCTTTISCTNFSAEKPISWAKPAHFDLFTINCTVWSHILSTGGDAVSTQYQPNTCIESFHISLVLVLDLFEHFHINLVLVLDLSGRGPQTDFCLIWVRCKL
jgi:hypothetical protein